MTFDPDSDRMRLAHMIMAVITSEGSKDDKPGDVANLAAWLAGMLINFAANLDLQELEERAGKDEDVNKMGQKAFLGVVRLARLTMALETLTMTQTDEAVYTIKGGVLEVEFDGAVHIITAQHALVETTGTKGPIH